MRVRVPCVHFQSSSSPVSRRPLPFFCLLFVRKRRAGGTLGRALSRFYIYIYSIWAYMYVNKQLKKNDDDDDDI